jgi:hypothetical protein
VFSEGPWSQKPFYSWKRAAAAAATAPVPEERTYGVWEGKLLEEAGSVFCGCRWTPDANGVGGGAGVGTSMSTSGGGGGGEGGGRGSSLGGPRVAEATGLENLVSVTVKLNLGMYDGLELCVKVGTVLGLGFKV